MRKRKYLFGPVPSRRFGRSLGVDMNPGFNIHMNEVSKYIGILMRSGQIREEPKNSTFYSSSPEYPAACRRDDTSSPKATTRQVSRRTRLWLDRMARRTTAKLDRAPVLRSSLLRRMGSRVGYAVIPLDNPPLAVVSFIMQPLG